VTCADRGRARNGPALGSPLRVVSAYALALAIVVLAALGAVSHSSASPVEGPAHPVLGVHLRHAGPDTAVISKPAKHSTQTPTSLGSGPFTAPSGFPVAVLLASVLLAPAGLARTLARSPYRLQPRRGPPQFAFLR
jgi:hypothetical protein